MHRGATPQGDPLHAAAARSRRIVRLLLGILLLIIVLAAAGVGVLFLRSDIVSFRPRLPEIRQMIEVQRAATPTLPPLLIQCLHAEGGAPDHFTARCLLGRYGLDKADALRWHTRTLFWSWSLYCRFSEAERDLLYCACLNDGAGKTGIHHLSLRLHGRPLEKLTEPELAALAVASRSPNIYLKDRARLDTISGDLLRSVKGG